MGIGQLVTRSTHHLFKCSCDTGSSPHLCITLEDCRTRTRRGGLVWTMDMSTHLLPEVVPEIDANPVSFYGTGLTVDRDRYRKVRNKASAAIEAGYRDHLNTILGNVVSDPRAFYRFINSKRTDTTSIPPIKSNNKVLLTDIDKAQCLNNYFGSVFTVEKDGSIPISTSLYPDMPDIQVTTPGVLKLLSQLDVRN